MKTRIKRVGLITGPLSFVCILLLLEPEGLSPEGLAVLASTCWVAIWWISEAVPIPVTSLIPIVLFPLTGALDAGETTRMYGHPLVFLYIGGFIIAKGIEEWGLHRRIALNIIGLVGLDLRKIILGFMIATAVLSMWISNTATSVMMLPIGMAIITQLGTGVKSQFGKALMLAIAYSASIGGVATLIGTPTNLVLAGIVQELFDTEITFSQWIVFGLPISVILLAICWYYLTRMAFRLGTGTGEAGKEQIEEMRAGLGRITPAQKRVAVVFGITALCWILRSFVLEKFLPGINDTVIAIAGSVAMFLVPSGRGNQRLLTWSQAVNIPWGIVLLFGGGMALAAGFQQTGLAEWIGNSMSLVQGLHFFVFVVILATLVNFLTEITSNVATASMLMPILAALSAALGVHPYGLMVTATLASSCAFMLPVATPPNAVVFGSGYIEMQDMVRAGFWLNMISIAIVSIAIYYYLPLIWGIELL